MFKKVISSLLAVILVLSSASIFYATGANTASAAEKKCENPYKGALAKYNPCKTHTETEYIDLKKDKYGTPISWTAAGVVAAVADKKAIQKVMGKVVSKVVPIVGEAVLLSDAVTVIEHYTAEYLMKNGIKKVKVVTKWKYELNPLKDGGGIPEKKIISVDVTPIKK